MVKLQLKSQLIAAIRQSCGFWGDKKEVPLFLGQGNKNDMGYQVEYKFIGHLFDFKFMSIWYGQKFLHFFFQANVMMVVCFLCFKTFIHAVFPSQFKSHFNVFYVDVCYVEKRLWKFMAF